ncbi:MAG: DUF4143 domain-containing protein, partial [Halobacteriovoraceae bacterium]|nr:DUF4143 domain-containing protein [Halobacteriovoraceae bacterium]
WEGLVIENIHSVLPKTAQTYFYRTSAGAEIDIIVKISSNEIWAVEIKSTTVPQVKKHFHQTCKDIKATHKYIVYGGDDEFSIGKNTKVVSLKKFMEKLARIS